MSDATAKTNGASQDQALPPPLFYSQPVPLSPQTHSKTKIRGELDFTFAAKASAIPLTVPEFVLAARHFPIILVGDDLVPAVAVALRQDDNLYVNAKGEWENGQYIPAYVRRYPFILLGAAGDEQLRLGIDDAAKATKPDARALFEGEKETDLVPQALSMCEQFHSAYLFTAEFAVALRESGLTETRPLDLRTADGKLQNIGTFVAINEEKFKAMPDATFLEWRKKGWVHAVYFHLQSMNNWEFLMARAATRMAVAAAIA